MGSNYYLRAYATNSVGTAYGNQVSFTTLSLATLTTIVASSITSTTATSGGNITTDGGAAITARGVCWSTSENPTIADTKNNSGTGTGIFVSSVNGLTLGNTYYVRAYATNSVGTAYGNQVSFTTAPGIGETYYGGILAYILQPGDPGYDANVQHGLIASPSNISSGIRWYNGINITTGATATALGTGNANTNTIVGVLCGGSYAAKLCYDLELGGYNDWYLPSKDELQMLYINSSLIGFITTAYPYWSSSENSTYLAWTQSFLHYYF